MSENLPEELRDIIFNAVQSRSELINRLTETKRDYRKECGHPEIILPIDYKNQYERNPIAARVVECLPQECWQVVPEVYEDENVENETPFETAWKNLSSSIRPDSKYQSELKRSPVWSYLERLDTLSGIATYAVMFLGLDDLEENEPLSKPAPGFENDITQGNTYGWVNISEDIGESKGQANLKFLRIFDETLAEVVQYESRITSPRYGQPLMYRLTFTNPEDQQKGGIGLPLATQYVHWSRVIHVCDKPTTSEIFGTPRMRPVYDRLVDLTKLYGGSAEMFWKGAFPGLALSIDPKMSADVPVDVASIRDSMFKYQNSLQRWFALAGVTAQSLSPQVADPTSQINVQLEAICMLLAIPKRIFMGSERGELASGQDAKTWNDRLKQRRETHITSNLVVPFVDRMIKVGALPDVASYRVSWETKDSLGPMEQATLASTITSALSTYVTMGLDSIIEPKDFLTRIIGMDETEAQSVLDNRTRTIEDVQAQKEDADAAAQLGQLGQIENQ